MVRELASILSRTGHVKPCLNLGGPPSKAKYYLLTDSEQVPRGNDEKNPDEGSEIDLEAIHLQTVRGPLQGLITYLLHYDSASYRV